MKAVEAAAMPILAPADLSATLGKMIANVRAKPDKWSMALSSTDPMGHLLAMLELLWQGHQRHGKAEEIANANQDQAQAALQLATTLVQFFSEGTIRSAAEGG